MAEVDGTVYVVGGYARGNVDQPLNQAYDPVADQWQTRASLQRGLNNGELRSTLRVTVCVSGGREYPATHRRQG